MSEQETGGQALETLGEVAAGLRHASLRCQDLLDDLEEERLGRWPAYTAFRETGATFRDAILRLRSLPVDDSLADVVAALSAGARAGLEATADIAEALQHGEFDAIDLGVQRLTIAGQQFVRARYLLQQRLGSPLD